MKTAGRRVVLCIVFSLLGSAAVAGVAAAATKPSAAAVRTYIVDGVRTSLDRSAVVATGAAIVEADHAAVTVTASRSDVRKLRRLRYRVTRYVAPRERKAAKSKQTKGLRARAAAFPAADSGYHTYQEVVDDTAAIVAANPSIVSRTPIGTSYGGRTIYALKISDNVAVDEAEPEVLFTANQHAREHLTVEMSIYLLKELTEKYATDARIKGLVDSREIWVIPQVNPDGAEFDVATGSYALWRKNRQPNTGSSAIGTDLNRNWAWQWGCCGGSSGTTSSETYRGSAGFSAKETQVVRDFVLARRVGGIQQIKTHIDWHTYSELILWPYGYTTADTATGLTTDQRNAFAALGQNMASTNGYTPEQSSDLYIADGTINDWLWGAQGIWSYTFEMYPTTSNPGFYPPDEVITRETTRNREAVLRFLEISDCPYKAIGKEAQYCGIQSTTLFSDDFETNKNWVVGSGSDTATLGKWERGDPAATTSGGAKQLGTTTSGVNDLVTGRLAGAAAGDYDVDGGLTTITSPQIALSGTGNFALSFSYYLAHGTNSSSADYLRVKVRDVGTGTTTTVFQELGAADNDNSVWASTTVNLNAYAGKTVTLVVEAADASTASLVEAAIDDVVVKR
jgi:carboxypeptidase T